MDVQSVNKMKPRTTLFTNIKEIKKFVRNIFPPIQKGKIEVLNYYWESKNQQKNRISAITTECLMKRKSHCAEKKEKDFKS